MIKGYSFSVRITKDLIISLRGLRPGEDCEEGFEVWVEIGIGLFRPAIGIAYGGYRHGIWKEAGKRYDLGYMFDRHNSICPYGVNGSRWDRWLRNKVKWWCRNRNDLPF